MKNILKYSVVAGAIIASAVSVNAVPTLVVEDSNGGTIGSVYTAPGGTINITTGDGLWTVVLVTGLSSPPFGGNPTTPYMDLGITATYNGNGTAGNSLILSWANDSFGPTTGSFDGQLSGHMASGTGLPVKYSVYYSAGSHLPTLGTPAPGTVMSTTVSPTLVGGLYVYSGGVIGGPVSNLANPYTLGEEVIINGAAAGSVYSLDASINTVPDGGMTLVFLGSALSALALLKRKLA